MTAQYKVYGMTDFTVHDGRVICYCSSLKRFAKLIGETYYSVSKFACVTGNDYEIKQATAQPDTPIHISREEAIAHGNWRSK